ncbi:putative AP-1 complex subunit mu-1-I [Blattamonas nauphoetae]|uniref:AP-1 complex subunit mu-1-I n=1 Tax=Blattamonas nauphoetae TaxID=2049346 RepID=A0ABQ9XNY8_9EUKA|nr:putative AP-1 complex subunit mu-1-I [Blattamonas nauphoetae]
MMDSQLSGMPVLHLGLNDKLALHQLSNESGDTPSQSTHHAIDLEDIHFHQCVRLSKFDTNRTISFIPPDRRFELMNYRIGKLQKSLISVTSQIYEYENSRIEMILHLTTNFNQKIMTKSLSVLVPVPEDADTPVFNQTIGFCVYQPEVNCILWNLGPVNGKRTVAMTAQMGLPTMSGGTSSRHGMPLQVNFEIPRFTLSGIHVNHLTINDTSGYNGIPFINYRAHAGEYIIRQNPPKRIRH